MAPGLRPASERSETPSCRAVGYLRLCSDSFAKHHLTSRYVCTHTYTHMYIHIIVYPHEGNADTKPKNPSLPSKRRLGSWRPVRTALPRLLHPRPLLPGCLRSPAGQLSNSSSGRNSSLVGDSGLGQLPVAQEGLKFQCFVWHCKS